ncbi:Fanconi anemia group J protein-like [Tigriopus californicus]|uniref:Fanconi anemia group J protein-like n=1 Tax=Tigriopus californicus TaxID=6832 RepID=UPI0027D9FA1F|nr:Fanconi anemia group J protein-like [Tigriopus californicus]
MRLAWALEPAVRIFRTSMATTVPTVGGTGGTGCSTASSGLLSPHTYTISGVKVHFPCKAYPSQVAMMNNIIRALQRGQNALLESPTGSGKSLALLCASLAWQQAETQKAIEYNLAVECGQLPAEFIHFDVNGEETSAELECPEVQAAIELAQAESLQTGAGFIPMDQDDDFVSSPPHKRVKAEAFIPPPSLPSVEPAVMRKVKKKTVPKIYFGTRTHKQITQIIRELNKTPYKDCKMTILASRDHTCIHPAVSKMKNRNEGCQELNDKKTGSGCLYRSNVKSKLTSHSALTAYRGTRDAWDIEDVVRVGQKVRFCPYYGVRELKTKAQIVFCPYNYLVEPTIRKSMDISLKGQILILDEAHNIEDSARSAASWQVTQEEIRDAMRDLEALVRKEIPETQAHRDMALVCSQLSVWIDSFTQDLTDYTDFASASKVWTGTEIIALFNVHGIGQDKYPDLVSAFGQVQAVYSEKQDPSNDDKGEEEVPGVHANTMSLLEGFFMILNYLFMDGMRHLNDYRVALVRTQSRKSFQSKAKGAVGAWINKKKGTGMAAPTQEEHKFTYTVNFWCLNPAVTFEELKKTIHSVILTSGTLSPMASFSSELDVKFPLKLEANHVIDKRQVWIRTLSHGPTGHSLNATFRNADSFGFQDEMGRLTLKVCQTIAHGILLFLPSYSMLNKLSERWQQTGVWEQLNRKKIVIMEPRFSDEFETNIRHFYDVIESTNHGPDPSGVDGALFMAVCRGKVSEGLDFADNNARVVICVGIPFPNFKDIQVDLKKKYNDQRKLQDRDILSGSDWYEIQAFRALNQALGRCIRHRRDWGGILMVDDRYQKIQRYIGSLSKWVRAGVIHHKDCGQMLATLEAFNDDMVQMDAENKAKEQEIQAQAAATTTTTTTTHPPTKPTDTQSGSWAELEKINKIKLETQREMMRLKIESQVEIPGPAACQKVALATKLAMTMPVKLPVKPEEKYQAVKPEAIKVIPESPQGSESEDSAHSVLNDIPLNTIHCQTDVEKIAHPRGKALMRRVPAAGPAGSTQSSRSAAIQYVDSDDDDFV